MVPSDASLLSCLDYCGCGLNDLVGKEVGNVARWYWYSKRFIQGNFGSIARILTELK